MNDIENVLTRIDLSKCLPVKNFINYLFNWLYEAGNEKQKYKNITNEECSNIYDQISIYIYKTVFSFKTYDNDIEAVMIYFIHDIYQISIDTAKKLIKIYDDDKYDDTYLYNMVINDNYINI
jgi:hypothetical protein